MKNLKQFKYIKLETFQNDPEMQVVSLNRHEVKNAFHPEMIAEITQIFHDFTHDFKLDLKRNDINDDFQSGPPLSPPQMSPPSSPAPSQPKCKAIVLRGEGTAFCAGADLNWMKEMVSYTFEQNVQDSEKLWDMFDTISECPVPVIGVLHGAVYGGALGLAACCDYVIADAKTQFCFSEVKLGLAPAVISSFILRKVADGFVRPLMLSAEIFNTETALRMGLVHQIVSAFEAWPAEMKKFSSNGLEAMQETKRLLSQIARGPSWNEQKKLTTNTISERRISTEAQTRLKKFIEKK